MAKNHSAAPQVNHMSSECYDILLTEKQPKMYFNWAATALQVLGVCNDPQPESRNKARRGKAGNFLSFVLGMVKSAAELWALGRKL